MRAFMGESLNIRVFTGIVPGQAVGSAPLHQQMSSRQSGAQILDFCTSATAARVRSESKAPFVRLAFEAIYKRNADPVSLPTIFGVEFSALFSSASLRKRI
jgi:hypothetical protein